MSEEGDKPDNAEEMRKKGQAAMSKTVFEQVKSMDKVCSACRTPVRDDWSACPKCGGTTSTDYEAPTE